jgi:hypothetical protein
MNAILGYLKGHVALVSALGVALQTEYSHAKWAPAIQAVIGAILVYVVPNVPKAPAVLPPPTHPSDSSMGTQT